MTYSASFGLSHAFNMPRPSHPELVMLIIFGEEDKLWSSADKMASERIWNSTGRVHLYFHLVRFDNKPCSFKANNKQHARREVFWGGGEPCRIFCVCSEGFVFLLLIYHRSVSSRLSPCAYRTLFEVTRLLAGEVTNRDKVHPSSFICFIGS